jgi:hypothetical protein
MNGQNNDEHVPFYHFFFQAFDFTDATIDLPPPFLEKGELYYTVVSE